MWAGVWLETWMWADMWLETWMWVGMWLETCYGCELVCDWTCYECGLVCDWTCYGYGLECGRRHAMDVGWCVVGDMLWLGLVCGWRHAMDVLEFGGIFHDHREKRSQQ